MAADHLVDDIIDDVWIDVFTFCSIKDFTSLRQASKRFHKIGMNKDNNERINDYWRSRCQLLCHNMPKDYKTKQWEMLYFQLHHYMPYFCSRKDPKTILFKYDACSYDCNLIVEMILFEKLQELKSKQQPQKESEESQESKVEQLTIGDAVNHQILTGRGKFKRYESPLIRACQTRNVTMVEYLLSFGEKVNTNIQMKDTGNTPLLTAIDRKESSIVGLLLANGADVNIEDNLGNRPLFRACLTGDVNILQQLIDTNKIDDYNASLKPKKIDKTKKKLVKSGIGGKEPNTPLGAAAARNHYECVELLFKTGKVDVNLGNEIGCSPLWLAASRGSYETVVALMNNKNVDVNKVGSFDNRINSTPLIEAICTGNDKLLTKMFEISDLNEKELKMNDSTSDGDENKQNISINKSKRVLDCTARDEDGMTIMHYVCKYSRKVKLMIEIVYERLKKVIKNEKELNDFINAKENGYGSTALMIACSNRNISVEMVEYIIEGCKADTSILDNFEEDHYCYAMRRAKKIERVWIHEDVFVYLGKYCNGKSRLSRGWWTRGD